VLLFCEVSYGKSSEVGNQQYWQKHEKSVHWQIQAAEEYDYWIMSHEESVRETSAKCD
jgi:hypothetical protein